METTIVRKKILISAYACLPNAGSEPGMGWNWVSRLALYHDVWLLTEENRFAPVIREFIVSHPELQGHLHVVGIPRERFGENIWSHLYYLSYRKWQKLAFQKAQELHSSIQFDLAHQLNMIGYREPGFLWQLPIPFIWGPVGGHAQMPWAYLPSLGFKGAMHYGLRNLLNAIQMRTMTRAKKAAKKADVLLAATEEDRLAIIKHHGVDTVLMNEQGTDPDLSNMLSPATIKRDNTLRIVWCGLFLARKGLSLGLHAIKQASHYVKIELHILGSGTCEQKWKELAGKLEINHLCYWYGSVEHQKVLEVMSESDVLLFNSLQEGTPAVVTEAIQMGLPVICHDMCGFGACVDQSCGIKVAPINPEKSIKGFAEALVKIGRDRELLNDLKTGALKRAKLLSWETKLEQLLQIYKDII